MENQNEDQTSTSSTSTSSAVPVEHIYFDGSQLSTASAASESNESDADQVSNSPGDVVAPLAICVINDINCEEDTEIRQQEPQVNRNQPPVCFEHQPSTNEDLSLKQEQDGEKKTQYYCVFCLVSVVVFGCCQRTEHEDCSHAHKDCSCVHDLSLTNCSCNSFRREGTVNRIDYPDASTSISKQPTTDDDFSETWENHPQQTFSQHLKVVSLFCDKCGVEEVFIIPPCCIIRYHYHCVIEYVDSGFTTCPQCRRPLQNNLTALADNQGGGDGGGGDGEGGSENMEGDQGDPGGGGDDDDDGGDGSAGGSPLPPVTPYDETFRQILLACMTGYLLADDGDEEENYEPMVDDQDHYEGDEY